VLSHTAVLSLLYYPPLSLTTSLPLPLRAPLCFGPSYAATPPGRPPYREKDGALLVVGALHEKLKSTTRYAAQLEAMLTQHVFPELSSPVGHLRAKVGGIPLLLGAEIR